MRGRPPIFVAVLLVLLGAGLVAWLAWRSREPSFNHRSLSEWTELYLVQEPGANPALDREINAALQAIGTNHLDRLLSWMAYDPSPRRQAVASALRTLPRALRRNPLVGRLWSDRAEARANNACYVLAALGPHAAPALPALTRMLDDTNSAYLAGRALFVLDRMGELGTPAIIATVNNPGHRLRDRAARVLTERGSNVWELLEVKPLPKDRP